MTKHLLKFPALVALVAASLFGQATMTQTTLSTAITGPPGFPQSTNPVPVYQNVITVGSTTGILAAGSLNQVQTVLVIDSEAMEVISISGNNLTVTRGVRGTRLAPHISGAIVWAGNPNLFGNETVEDLPVAGNCNPTSILALPQVRIPSGKVYTCPSTGSNANTWVLLQSPTGYYVQDTYFWQPWTDCNSTVSGNASGTNGYTTAGASNTPVVQASTSVTGTNTHTYTCLIHLPSSLSSFAIGRGAQIKDVQFYYGVQTTALGTQVAVPASGTYNGSLVFSSIALPAPGASETPSTVAPVRLDSGTLVITPAAASANVATTTAGAFYSQLFQPATPIALNTDRQAVYFTVTLQNTATSATVTNSPGILVHWIWNVL